MSKSRRLTLCFAIRTKWDSQIEELAQFVARTRWQDMPAAVQRHTKLVLLDTLGVILAGAERPEVGNCASAWRATARTGATVYARGWPTHDPRTAALLNGIAGRAIELCEGLRLVSGQAAMQVLPGVLAVGEHAGSTGREMLAAFVCSATSCRRGSRLAFTPRPLAHQNGQASLLAAAAAGARLRGLDARGCQPRDAHRDDAAADAELYERRRRRDHAQRRRRHERFRRRARARARARGFEAQDDAIEEALGKLVGGGFKPEGLLDELGTRWDITRNYFRLYACCNPIHPALDCCRQALADTAAAARGHRAHRRRDLSLRVGHAQSGSAELLRVEVFAAARRGGDGRARATSGHCGDRRRGGRRSRASPRCASACAWRKTRR